MKFNLDRISSNRIVSISAFLISIGTLVTFVYQTKLMREQQNAAVLPYLEMWYTDTPEKFEINIYNKGLGPAFIQDYKIYKNDSIYRM
jgi:hypothetical protein